MNKKYGYCRCSTNEEKQDISRQEKELVDRGVKKEDIVLEYISGTKNKPALLMLIDKCNPGDEIICTELSRISRSIKDFNNTVELLQEKKLRLELIMNNIIIDFTKDKLDPFTSFYLNIMMAFNDLEANVTRERVKSGLDNAKSKGIKLGRPILNRDNIPDKFYKNLDLYNRKEINKVEFAKLMGWSRSRIDRYLEIAKRE